MSPAHYRYTEALQDRTKVGGIPKLTGWKCFPLPTPVPPPPRTARPARPPSPQLQGTHKPHSSGRRGHSEETHTLLGALMVETWALEGHSPHSHAARCHAATQPGATKPGATGSALGLAASSQFTTLPSFPLPSLITRGVCSASEMQDQMEASGEKSSAA